MSILVIGSFMMDQVATTPRAPEQGETVIGTNFMVNPGGKGINQAVAAARLGAEVVMLGKLGDDANGAAFRRTMQKENIAASGVLTDAQKATGVGCIYKEENGHNRIVVIPGANLAYTETDFDQAFAGLVDVEMAILQLEMDFSTTCAIVQKLKKAGIPVILNPAPARALPAEILQNLDYITPNETELALLTGCPTSTPEEVEHAADHLLAQGVKNVVVTLGEKGALIKNAQNTVAIAGQKVDAIDTVAAGDSFNGALAVALCEGESLEAACRFANAVGAITVTREGAIASLPYRQEIKEKEHE